MVVKTFLFGKWLSAKERQVIDKHLSRLFFPGGQQSWKDRNIEKHMVFVLEMQITQVSEMIIV